MSWWPTVDEERGSSGWRKQGWLLAVVFFVLTVLAVAAFYWVMELMHLPKGIVTAVVAIAVAEWLIHRRRFFGSGIEAGLWLGGLFAIIFSLPSSGKPEALLTFVAACAIAGFRVRSAVFGCAAVVFLLAYIDAKTRSEMAMLFGLAASIAAAFLLRREWQRPSTERLLAMIAIVMPVAAEVAWTERVTAPVPFVFAAAAAILIALGIDRRDRMVLIAGAVTAAIAAYEAREWIDVPLEVKLIAAGVALIAIAALIARSLRGRTRGFVAEPSAVTPYDEAMQILATLPSAHVAPAPAATSGGPALESGDGSSFGGAGAGGRF